MEAHDSQGFYEPAPAIAESAGQVDRLSSGARLQMIASILAMAVLRRKARTSMQDGLSAIRESLPDSGEGLDLFREQSVHARQLVQKPR